MPLNKLNKSRGMLMSMLMSMLMRNFVRKGKGEINAEKKEKDLRENEEIKYPKQRKKQY
jgi:hypothetical protein